MQSIKLTGQEQFILLQALKNYEEKVNETEFPKNAIFTKAFVLNHVSTLTKRVEKMQEELQMA